jgi:hypothetical protein
MKNTTDIKPESPVAGEMCVNKEDNLIYLYTEGQWHNTGFDADEYWLAIDWYGIPHHFIHSSTAT